MPLLRQLGLVGLDGIEPVVLAALATSAPLLLIGPHGTAKSLLLCRLCEALGLSWRHYNASLLNYDDLVGYPLPDGDGSLRFVQTPASIWGAEAVFLDEISRCRPDMQNRLFSIIHERRVQGIPIERLVHRWAAMNPPAGDNLAEQDWDRCAGSEPLDAALADRFNFVVEVPSWQSFSEADREAVIRSTDIAVDRSAAESLRQFVDAAKGGLVSVDRALGQAFTEHVRLLADRTAQLGINLSGRRAAMLLRNIVSVHSVRLQMTARADPGDSAWLAFEHSLPQRAQGAEIDRSRLLVAHNDAWNTVHLEHKDPRRLLAAERDPARRAILALEASVLTSEELSAYVADGLASLPPGGRHALASFAMESPRVHLLHAAVAEHVAELDAVTLVAQDLRQQVATGSPKHLAWQEVVKELATLKEGGRASTRLANLVTGLFSKGDIAAPDDVRLVVDSWHAVRWRCSWRRP